MLYNIYYFILNILFCQVNGLLQLIFVKICFGFNRITGYDANITDKRRIPVPMTYTNNRSENVMTI